MSRPELFPTKTAKSNSNSSGNPVANWLAGRKERRNRTADEAARLVTNEIAENEAMFIEKLESIDFFRSKLPKEDLEKKTRKEQPCGDLEYAVRGIIQLLQRSTKIIKMDIRPIDQKLMTLVLLYSEAIELGYPQMAWAARVALVRGFNEIRSKISQNQPTLTKQFVEVNTAYLEQWITLVGMAQVADQMQANVKKQKREYDQKKTARDECLDALKGKLQKNDDYVVAFNYIREHNTPADRAKWTDVQRKVHTMCVEQRMLDVNLELNTNLLSQQEIQLASKIAQVKMLSTATATTPIVCDPNLMNKFREDVDKLMLEMAKADQEIDETLTYMDDVEGRIRQLENAPGAIRAREVITEQAEKMLAEIQKRQKEQGKESQERIDAKRQALGILSEEEEKALQATVMAEQAKVLADLVATEGQSEEEGEANVN